MSGIASVQDSQEVNNINPTQDLQKSTSLHGRVFHKITEGGKYIVQTINKVAQSILSTCIRVVSFGRYNLDSLKSYLFSNKASSSKLPLRSAPPLPPSNAPPPPPMPTPADPNRASSSRFSSAKAQSSSFQEPSILRAESADVRSSFNPPQDSPEEDDNRLEDGANPGLNAGSSLGENANRISGQENSEPNHEGVKVKKPKPGLMGITQDAIASALKGLKKSKNKVAQE